MSVNIIVKQLSKPTQTLTVEDGTTIQDLLEDQLQVTPDGKTFTVMNENGTSTQGLSYILRDADVLTISVKNKGAIA